MDDQTVISVKNVHKSFRLPTSKAGSIKTLFTNMAKLKKYREFEVQKALHGVSFEVKKGEFFGIVGRNGSGKSTLLKMLAGIYQPTKGSIETTGKIVPFIELGVGFNPELSGRDNVYLNGALLGFTEKQVDEKYDAIVEFAELEKFMGQKLKNYSSGMQVRLAFSVATILADSDILLLDEVLAVGDADFQRKCFDYFKTLKKNKKTVVFVSHDMDAVREYCDKAVLIDDGKVAEYGDARTAAKKYTQLFTETESLSTRNSDSRWGTMEATIEDIQAKASKTGISIKFQIKAHRKIQDIVYGFSIKNGEGLSIIASNSKLLELETIGLNEKERYLVSFDMPNYLNNGIHTVDLAVLGGDGVTVFDWQEDAVQLLMKGKRRVPSITNPEVKCSVTLKGAK